MKVPSGTDLDDMCHGARMTIPTCTNDPMDIVLIKRQIAEFVANLKYAPWLGCPHFCNFFELEVLSATTTRDVCEEREPFSVVYRAVLR